MAETQSAAAPTVLVVDDDKTTVHVLSGKLKQRGFHVLSATDGDSALEVARQHKGTIDALLTDVIMPKMSGPKLAELFLVTRPKTRIVFMSGLVQASAIPPKLLAASTFLQKQHPIDGLVDRVEQLMRKAPAERPST